MVTVICAYLWLYRSQFSHISHISPRNNDFHVLFRNLHKHYVFQSPKTFFTTKSLTSQESREKIKFFNFRRVMRMISKFSPSFKFNFIRGKGCKWDEKPRFPDKLGLETIENCILTNTYFDSKPRFPK